MTDHQDWDWVPAHPDRPEQHHSQRGLAHPHQLVVDELDWSAVERALQHRNQSYRNKTIKYGIMQIPTLLVFKGGQVVEQLVGYKPKEALQQALDKHLA